MENIDWGSVEAAKDYVRPTAGGYVMRIAYVENVEASKYLLLKLDFVEGELKDYGLNIEERTNDDWGYMKAFRSYKETAKGFFKAFLVAVEQSNRNFSIAKFRGNESMLEGMLVGAVLFEEEYRGNDGSIKIRAKVDKIIPVDDIRKGKFKVKPLKKLEMSDTTGVPFIGEDIPF